MDESPIKILLIEDNATDALLFKKILKECNVTFEFKHLMALKEVALLPPDDDFDVVIVDLHLPDSTGLSTVTKIKEQLFKNVPLIVMTGLNNDETGMEAVKLGAEDYLIKGKIGTHSLLRSIRYAIERNKLRKELFQMSIFDELTGLHNRRGFKILIEQQIKRGQRIKQPVFVIIIDINKFKGINDNFGHPAGDKALKDTAKILKNTFRDNDIIARWGGDEFIVLGVDAAPEIMASIKKRLDDNIKAYNSN